MVVDHGSMREVLLDVAQVLCDLGCLRGIALAIAGHERDDRPLVADEDERLDDLAEIAADGVGRVLR